MIVKKNFSRADNITYLRPRVAKTPQSKIRLFYLRVLVTPQRESCIRHNTRNITMKAIPRKKVTRVFNRFGFKRTNGGHDKWMDNKVPTFFEKTWIISVYKCQKIYVYLLIFTVCTYLCDVPN